MKKILIYNSFLLQILLLQILNVSYITASEKQTKGFSSKSKGEEKSKTAKKDEKSSSKKNSYAAAAAVSGDSVSKHVADQNKKSHQKMNKDSNAEKQSQEDLEAFRKEQFIDSLNKAIQEQNIQEIQKVLATGLDIHRDARDDYGILYEAILIQNSEILQILFDAGLKIPDDAGLKSSEKSVLLYLAAELGNPEIINILINHGADVQPLISRYQPKYPLYLALREKKSQAVKALLDNGANVDWLDRHNDINSLIYAVGNSDVACLKELLDHRSDMTIKEYDTLYGQVHYFSENRPRLTGYHLAAKWGEEDMVNEYLKHHVDIDMKDSIDRTALHYAIAEGKYNVVKLLLNRGADANAVDKYGITPILLAAEKDLSMLQLLLDYKANIQVVDNEHNTALHHAAKAGKTEMVKKLIQINRNWVSAGNKENKTPLHIAAENNDSTTVPVLLEAGADARLKSKHGKKPVEYVLEDYPELIELLIEAEKKQDENFQANQEEDNDRKNDDD
jgi:ankyrin repeat protein